jgi:hypothetical protein
MSSIVENQAKPTQEKPTENQAKPTETQATETQATETHEKPVKLSQTVIVDQHMALNVLVGFIGVAQKRGAFALDESAKIYECIKKFQGEASN